MLLDFPVETQRLPQLLHFTSESPNRLSGNNLFTSLLEIRAL